MTHYLLDTSALLSHYFSEPGGDMVEALLADQAASARISVVTWVEFKLRMTELRLPQSETDEIFAIYSELLQGCLPLTTDCASEAFRLRKTMRLPLVDALIAGTAAAHRSILVHRDKHMREIPERFVKQLRLPDKPECQQCGASPQPNRES